MATRVELMEALRAADAAGNAEDAQRIAGMIDAVPADDGQSPMPVDPRWGDDSTLKGKAYNYAREGLIGVSKGVADFPNIIPNAYNAGYHLAHTWLDPEGTPAPPPPAEKWFDTPVDNIEQLNPQTPGYEHTRQLGQTSGAALPFGVGAAIGAPLMSEAGGDIGWFADRWLDPNDRRKWEQTGEMVAPAVVGLGSKGAVKAGLVPRPETIGAMATKGGGVMLGGPKGYMIADAVQPLVKPVSRALAKPVGGAVKIVTGGGDTLPELFSRSLSPLSRPTDKQLQGGW